MVSLRSSKISFLHIIETKRKFFWNEKSPEGRPMVSGLFRDYMPIRSLTRRYSRCYNQLRMMAVIEAIVS